MVYPGSSPDSEYFNSLVDAGDVSGLGIHGDQQLVDAADMSGTMLTGYASDMSSPADNCRDAFVGLPPRYDMLQSYGQPDGAAEASPGGIETQPKGLDFGLVFSNQRAPPARRGPFKDHEQREKTAHTRKIGSCIRCRMQRIRVSSAPTPWSGSQ
jgi:hypothetical protein